MAVFNRYVNHYQRLYASISQYYIPSKSSLLNHIFPLNMVMLNRFWYVYQRGYGFLHGNPHIPRNLLSHQAYQLRVGLDYPPSGTHVAGLSFSFAAQSR